MFVLGLTGSIATGKSTVVQIFQECQIPVVDGDLLAKGLQEKGSPALDLIAETFGSDILLPEGKLNRERLAQIVFSSEKDLQKLNELLDPFLRQAFQEAIDKHAYSGHKLLVVDIPLLFERNYRDIFDEVMLVYTDSSRQLERLMNRNQFSQEEAQKRINAQWPIDKKKELADTIIDNSGSLEATKQQVLNWLEKHEQSKGGLI